VDPTHGRLRQSLARRPMQRRTSTGKADEACWMLYHIWTIYDYIWLYMKHMIYIYTRIYI
jgi:hypothetical protein